MLTQRGQTMQSKQQAVNAIYKQLARAKLVKVKKTGLFKLVCAFNVTQRSELTGKYIFPSEAKCNFVSGHIDITDLPRVMQQASQVLRTNNIELEG
jgi:hydrogenase maturation factor HypF (carbamoyltransferase family)